MVTAATDSNGSVTFVVRHRVRRAEARRYEAWLDEAYHKAATYPGHQGVNIIRPPSGGNEYTIVLRFRTLAEAKDWAESDERKRLLKKIEDAFEAPDCTEIKTGIEFWFTPSGAPLRSPPRSKQFLVTLSVIWPLTLILPPVFKALFDVAPVLGGWGISQLLVDAAIVAATTYLIMPVYTRAISGWLHAVIDS